MILPALIAKVLALTEAILDYFVTVTVSPGQNICGTIWYTYNAQLTACGTSFVADLVALITGLTRLAPSLLQGLFAVS